MEHRWRTRRPIRIDAVVYRRGQPVARCRSRDVSEQGLFLELDGDDLGLAPGSGVKLELSMPGRAGPTRTHLSGIIVHRGHDGVGVLLTRPSAALCGAIASHDARTVHGMPRLRQAASG